MENRLARQPHPGSTRSRQVLITGGAGFIGSHLAGALLERGYAVTIIDDLSTGRFENISHMAGHPDFRFAIDFDHQCYRAGPAGERVQHHFSPGRGSWGQVDRGTPGPHH